MVNLVGRPRQSLAHRVGASAPHQSMVVPCGNAMWGRAKQSMAICVWTPAAGVEPQHLHAYLAVDACAEKDARVRPRGIRRTVLLYDRRTRARGLCKSTLWL